MVELGMLNRNEAFKAKMRQKLKSNKKSNKAYIHTENEAKVKMSSWKKENTVKKRHLKLMKHNKVDDQPFRAQIFAYRENL